MIDYIYMGLAVLFGIVAIISVLISVIRGKKKGNPASTETNDVIWSMWEILNPFLSAIGKMEEVFGEGKGVTKEMFAIDKIKNAFRDAGISANEDTIKSIISKLVDFANEIGKNHTEAANQLANKNSSVDNIII